MKGKRKKITVTSGPTNSTDKLKQNMGYNCEKRSPMVICRVERVKVGGLWCYRRGRGNLLKDLVKISLDYVLQHSPLVM